VRIYLVWCNCPLGRGYARNLVKIFASKDAADKFAEEHQHYRDPNDITDQDIDYIVNEWEVEETTT